MSGAGGSSAPSLFNVRTVAAVVVAGMLAFVAFLWLTAYSPELRGGDDGGAHALSNAATGFRGLGDLLENTGGGAVRARSASRYPEGGLLVLTPTPMTDPKLLAKIVGERSAGRTLIILPKWATTRLKTTRKGWVSGFGTMSAETSARPLSDLVSVTASSADAKAPRVAVRTTLVDAFRLPAEAQTIRGDGLTPMIEAPGGGTLVARLTSHPQVFILADPDLLNNMGLKDPATARAAIGLMDHMTEAADRKVTFDLTLNGFEGTSNLLRLAFEPPFLAATLCLIVAAALAALGAFFPFGPAIREARAISFGKGALVSNSADLVIGAGRETLVADRYARLTRDAAAARLGLSPVLSPQDVSEHLDRLGFSEGKPFAALFTELQDARGRSAIATAAAALHRWKKERLA